MMPIKDRQRAILEGRKRYFTGKPCSRGHVSERYVKGHMCVECAADKSRSEEKKAYDKARYAERKDEIRERVMSWQKENPERLSRRKREWARRNPDKVRANAVNQAAKRRATTKSGVTSTELARWKREQKPVCYWCGASCKREAHADHYVPLAKGGAHEIENLVLACPACNRKKSAKDPYEFAASIGRLL